MDDQDYLDAIVDVRNLEGRLELSLGRELDAILLEYADQLEAAVAGLSGARAAALREAAILLRRLADALDEALVEAIGQYRELSFDQVTGLLRNAEKELIESEIPGATVGAVPAVPPIQAWNYYASLSPAGNWKTVLKSATIDAAEEADALVKQALLKGWSPIDLASRLRRYVDGAETFEQLFEQDALGHLRLDLRKVPKSLRGAARQVEYNARRIAFSELHNARAEADLQQFISDPVVEAVRWTLSPDRGTLVPPDQCDVLAAVNLYGMGPGVYPVRRVPLPPHPFDRCNRIPVLRRWAQRNDPKPDPEPDWQMLTEVRSRQGVTGGRWQDLLMLAKGAANVHVEV